MYRVFLSLYSVLYSLLLPLYLLVFIYRALFQDKRVSSFLQRIGKPPQIPDDTSGEHSAIRIWIHAVSVGEVKAIKPLIDALKTKHYQLLVSTVTQTGQKMASDLFGNQAQVFYLPLDWQWICRRYLLAIKPKVILIAESELWPGFIAASHSLNIPTLIVNGRVSDRSFRKYKLIPFLTRPLLNQITQCCMQTQEDKRRITIIGAIPSRVNRMGNLKYDYQPTQNSQQKEVIQLIRTTMKPNKDELLWVCGSTREGEEEILLDIFKTLSESFSSLKLILAPRHPHRTQDICKLIEQHKFTYLKRSLLLNQPSSPPQILILDTIGELSYLYQLADLVFVGGSLFPTGGHNIIEAAHFGKPILFGPHMDNFKEISTSFQNSHAAIQVKSNNELLLKLQDLISDPAAREFLGHNARKVVKENQGAVNRTIKIVQKYTKRDDANSQLKD